MSVPPSPEPTALLADLLGRCAFPAAGTAVRCGVSGGADSTALAVLAVAAGCAATLVHVDHGLRPGSADEADVVRALGDRLRVPVETVGAPVPPGANLEERARTVRHDALGPETLLGHTADDQAETVLLALVRGTGLHGLAGMRPDGRRPLLGLRRRETRALCDALGIATVEDPSNDDPRFRRNRIRHEALPLLADIAGRDVVPLLCRTATTARAAVEHLDAEAADLDPTDARALAAAPQVTAVLALRTWLRSTHPLAHPPDAAALDRALAVARGEIRATELVGGVRLERSGGRLRLVPSGPPDRPAPPGAGGR